MENKNDDKLYNLFDKLYNLFEELVPSEGRAGTVAGELVRSVNRINYRYFNDGDLIGEGYGKQTVNPPARFLKKWVTNHKEMVDTEFAALWDQVSFVSGVSYADWNVTGIQNYEDWLHKLIDGLIKLIENHPELKTIPNQEDMWDSQNPEEDVDDWEDEEEEDWGDAE